MCCKNYLKSPNCIKCCFYVKAIALQLIQCKLSTQISYSYRVSGWRGIGVRREGGGGRGERGGEDRGGMGRWRKENSFILSFWTFLLR